MTQTAGDFLDIDALVDKEGGVDVAEIVHADVGEACRRGEEFVAIFDAGAPQALRAAADAIGGCPAFVPLLAGLVLLQDMYEGQRHLQVPVRGAVFGRGFHILTFELLGDAAAYVDDVILDVCPAQGVDLPLAHPGIECQVEERIVPPVDQGDGAVSGDGDIGLELLRGVVVQLVLGLLKIDVGEGSDGVEGILGEILHPDGKVEKGMKFLIEIAFCGEGQVHFVDGCFPALQSLSANTVEAQIANVGENGSLQGTAGFVPGGGPDFLLFDGLELLEKLRYRDAGCGIGGGLAVFLLQAQLQELGFLPAIGYPVDLLGLALAGGVVDPDAVLLLAVLFADIL